MTIRASQRISALGTYAFAEVDRKQGRVHAVNQRSDRIGRRHDRTWIALPAPDRRTWTIEPPCHEVLTRAPLGTGSRLAPQAGCAAGQRAPPARGRRQYGGITVGC